jgi:2-phospho-L-lactate guanylyltransferase
MRVLAVPVKPLDRAKHRLSSILSPAERAILTLAMLDDVLDACLAQSGWDVWVVSRAKEALEAASRRGATPLPERGRSLLAAIGQVEGEVGPAPSELAVVLADLPMITAPALHLALGRPGPVVTAPAESDGGTNLLLRRPPTVIPARFGRSSFAKHRAEAYRAGLTFQEVRTPELSFDLDRPSDLPAVIETGAGGWTRAACLAMGLPERLRVRA